MKALKALALLAVCGLTFSLTGCGGSYPEKPEDVVKAFNNAMNEKDFDGAKTYTTKAGGEALDKVQQMMESLGDLGAGGEEKKEAIKACECTEDGDNATCECETDAGTKKTTKLVKEDGKWKVDFKKGN